MSEIERLIDSSLPPGATVEVDAATFEPLGARVGAVEGDITTDGQTRYRFFVLRDGERWKLVSTEELP